jgi:hypothetical protein
MTVERLATKDFIAFCPIAGLAKRDVSSLIAWQLLEANDAQ